MSSVSKSKKACILSHALFKSAPVTFYHNCLKQAWYVVKNWTSHDQAYLLAFARQMIAGNRDAAGFLYTDSKRRGVGEDFRRVVRMLWL